jgi:hypothetical protein
MTDCISSLQILISTCRKVPKSPYRSIFSDDDILLWCLFILDDLTPPISSRPSLTWDSVLCTVYKCPPAKGYCRAVSRNWILECRFSSTIATTLSSKSLTRWVTCSPSPVGLQRTRNVTSIGDLTDRFPIFLLSVTVSEPDRIVAAC